ncbi:hypothetical protein FRB96_006127 [Tulasnella sp. 330]|nr:hypothetical protein FRB96_006127 [Tulasnella sp. 330]KAG8880001.1 hypothetical protein FRB97_001248 [Tulasnella sp. 331]
MSSSILRLFSVGVLAAGALAIPTNKTATKVVTSSKPAYPAPWASSIVSGLATIADTPTTKKATSQAKYEAKTALATTTMTSAQIQSYLPYTHLAASAYCASNIISTWTCGQHCTAMPGMIVYATGGDNEDVPDWYVGYLPSLASAVVVHQGTTPSAIESDLVDADFFFTSLNPTYFPGVPSSVEIHSGFVDAHDTAAPAILAAIESIMTAHGVKQVTCIGHSLGGAIAILDAMSLKATLPATTTFKVVTFGQPRVGNQAFADYVDANFSDNSRITHNEDIVPIVPGMFLGFVHSSGEKHIDPSTTWWACSGQDNEADPQCSTGEVPEIWDGNTADHTGPYVNGIVMGC